MKKREKRRAKEREKEELIKQIKYTEEEEELKCLKWFSVIPA